jgi:hypothetical protein
MDGARRQRRGSNPFGPGLFALIYEAAAAELDQAARHCRTAAHHFREREIPRAAAHAWAAVGHVRIANDSLEDQARTHARKSKPL